MSRRTTKQRRAARRRRVLERPFSLFAIWRSVAAPAHWSQPYDIERALIEAFEIMKRADA